MPSTKEYPLPGPSRLRSIATALLLAVVVLAFTIGVVAPRLPPVVGKPDVSREVSLTATAQPRLRFENRNGALTIRAADKDSLTVKAEISVYRYGEVPEQLARDYAASLVSLHESKGELVIITEPAPRPDALEVRVDYEIAVPTGTGLDILCANGNVEIGEGCAEVTVVGENTDITVNAPLGAVAATTTNGRIHVWEAADGARLSTANGNIYCSVLGGDLYGETTNGQIVAKMLRPDTGASGLTTRNGGITVMVHEDYRAQIDVRTGHGAIRCDLPVDTGAGSKGRRRLSGVMNGGETELRANTLNGNIWIAEGGS